MIKCHFIWNIKKRQQQQQQYFICSKHSKHIYIENYNNYNNLGNRYA